jgi:small nuclear ribonucleoprotein (snRNP)-like protein
MEININCSLQEFEQVKTFLNGKSIKVILLDDTKFQGITKSKQKRHNLILKHLEEDVNIGVLYNVLRRKGYPLSYKSFQRDISEMVTLNYIVKKTTSGGSQGTTTIISKVKGGKK